MPDELSITHFISEMKRGDDEAVQRLWDRYFRRLVSLARTRLRGARRRVADEEDVALQALVSLVKGAQAGRFTQLRDRDDLWRLMVKITVRKAVNQLKMERALKRGGGRVRGESAFLNQFGTDSAHGIDQAIQAELTPEFSDAIFKSCDDLLLQLTDETLRLIAVRKLEGYTNAEIAAELGCVERTIDRKLARIRTIWKDHLETPDS